MPFTSPTPASVPDAIKIVQTQPKAVAVAISNEFRNVRVRVSGSMVVLSGPPNEVSNAKALIALLDVSPPDAKFTQVYRLKNVDAQSVADLLSRSFHDAQITVDKDLNALSVSALSREQQRISDAIGQLDTPSAGSIQSSAAGPPVAVPGAVNAENSTMQILTLKAAIPGPIRGSQSP